MVPATRALRELERDEIHRTKRRKQHALFVSVDLVSLLTPADGRRRRNGCQPPCPAISAISARDLFSVHNLPSGVTTKGFEATLFSMPAPTGAPPGRNQPCYCGSGRKYKHCCLEKDDAKAAAKRAKTAAAAEAAAGTSETAPAVPTAAVQKSQTHQPWKATTSRGFVPRSRTPRKVGGG
jgi:SEC-C motif-containing protein